MDSWFLLLVTFGIAIFFLISNLSKQRKWPPGPPGLPLLGNLLQIDRDRPHHLLSSWAKVYGSIFRLKLMGRNIVVLSSYENIKQASVTDSWSFAGRPYQMRGSEYVIKGEQVLLMSDNTERWRRIKKTVMNSLRTYGEGLQKIEDLVHRVSAELRGDIEERAGEAFDAKDMIQETMIKIMHQIIFASAASKSVADDLMEVERGLVILFALGGEGTELEVLPWLKYFKRSYLRKLQKLGELRDTVMSLGLSTRKNRTEGAVECVADSLLQGNKSAPPGERLEDRDILNVLSDLMAAGISTSSSALYAMFALCINKPNLQQSLQAEVDDVIGSRGPKLADRENMPFMNACILELLRYISHVPTSIPHKTMTDVEIDGYTLPKGTEVWMNLWYLHHDEKHWDEPWEFKPERFLTPDGQLVPPDHHNRQRLMAFGAGRRVCVGEMLAKSRLFILLAMILQHFTVLPEDDDHRPETDPRKFVTGIVLNTPRYKLRIVPRQTQ